MNIENIENNEIEHANDNEHNDVISEQEIRDYIDSSKENTGCKQAENFKADEEKEIIFGDQLAHPYYDEDPDVGKNKFTPSLMLTRGCINIPQSYVPISKLEMDRNAKLSIHDWMSKIKPPFVENNFDCVEVRFKNSKKDFFRLPEGLEITEGDVVAVEGYPGHDIGIVTLIGELCKVQMKRKKINPESDTIKKLYRRAKATDIEKWVQAIEREDKTLFRTREIIQNLNLDMKINDVEYQGDNTKAIFYYTADDRVDFRQLIKLLADEFRVRIEMKQIGARQEASRLGGIGTCGRELCCSCWLNTFNSVSTQVARVQQIFSNPQKLAGQCGKLKCCLNFEYDVYLDELKSFPEIGVPIFTKKGKANYIKTNVFRRVMWYAYEGNSEFIMLSVDDVAKLISMNRKRQPIENIEAYQIKVEPKSNINV
ncbi:MAG: regulatory iron-sulfur-containing complex subunit RicT [Bacteroidales bacterium]|jgi:cell fate regulator YaaT (PSP1 superfamily)|nr:regulatory iron-sulfur-containing complex subunit RicT [Bacteroidales bacterium]MDD4702990.1 regulatory iron-sulfur-containing complex subunit RicT [Bacteroidales bacterium]MDX9798436.1 regulatory iron-sulfur-containing complex subunit RicT [Bacteroidales bacterium]